VTIGWLPPTLKIEKKVIKMKLKFFVFCFIFSSVRSFETAPAVQYLLQLLSKTSFSEVLNPEFLSEKCRNHTEMIQQKSTNPVQSLTDGYWDLKSEILWIVYTCEFCARFQIKLAPFAKKIFFFISKQASLVQNHPRNRANVNAPLKNVSFQGIPTEGEGSVQLTSSL
jgi:hypothetical protein